MSIEAMLTSHPVITRDRNFRSLAFPYKLWYITNDASISSIEWNVEGDRLIFDSPRFQKEVLENPVLFKTSCMSSFLRQLNLYGFRKTRTRTHHLAVADVENGRRGLLNRDSLSPTPRDLQEFRHPHFRSHHFELLDSVKRRQLGDDVFVDVAAAAPIPIPIPLPMPGMVTQLTNKRGRPPTKFTTLDKSRRALSAALMKAKREDNAQERRSKKMALEIARYEADALYAEKVGHRSELLINSRQSSALVNRPAARKSFAIARYNAEARGSRKAAPLYAPHYGLSSSDVIPPCYTAYQSCWKTSVAVPMLSDWFDQSEVTEYDRQRHYHEASNVSDSQRQPLQEEALQQEAITTAASAAWKVWENTSLDGATGGGEWWTDITSLYSCEDAYLLRETLAEVDEAEG